MVDGKTLCVKSRYVNNSEGNSEDVDEDSEIVSIYIGEDGDEELSKWPGSQDLMEEYEDL